MEAEADSVCHIHTHIHTHTHTHTHTTNISEAVRFGPVHINSLSQILNKLCGLSDGTLRADIGT